MGTLTTALVGLNVQTLAPAPVAGAQADSVLIVNLDTANTVNLGSSSTNLAYPLGPLASAVLTAPVYAKAATVALEVGIAPGGSSYSPGALTITGPVTATITGPVEAEITGTADVNVTNATIDIIGAGGFVVPGETGTVYTNPSALTAGPGLSTSKGPFNVSTYASLDFSFGSLANSSAAGGSAMCAIITFEWSDAAGNVIGNDTIGVCQAQSAAGILPCRGTQVTITVFNPGSVGTLSFPTGSVLVDGSFRTVDALKFTAAAESPPSFSGVIVLGSNPPAYSVNGWLANINSTGLTAGTIYMWLLPMFNGPVSGWWQVITDALANDAVIIDLAYATVGSIVAGTGNNAILQNLPSAVAASPLNISFYAPPSQLALVAKPSNVNTAVFLTLTGQG